MSEKDKSVDVVIPAYRSSNTIGAVLEGLQEQDFDSFSVYVVDDSPNARCQDVVRSHAGDLNLTYLQNESNSGLAYSMNRGVRESEADIIVMLHDDCVPQSPDWLSSLVSTLEENPSAGVVKSRFLLDFNEMSSLNVAFGYVYDMGEHIDVEREGVEKVGHVETKCDAYRREVFDDIGLFEDRWLSNEDTEFSHRMKSNGYRMLRDNNVAVRHILEGNERQGSLESHLKKGYIYTKHAAYPFFQYGMNYKIDALFATILILIGALPAASLGASFLSIFFSQRFALYAIPLTAAGLVMEAPFVGVLVGGVYLILKGVIRAARYVSDFGKAGLAIPILLFSILWEISAAMGWMAGMVEALARWAHVRVGA